MTTTEVVRARVAAGDIQVGDRVARSRGLEFLEVLEVKRLVVTVRLHFADGSMDWPRADATWWRELPGPGVAYAAAAAGRREGPVAS